MVAVASIVAIACRARPLDDDPFDRHRRTAFGRTLEAHVIPPASAIKNLDRPTTDDLPAAAAEPLFIDRFPVVKDVARTKRRQLPGG